MLKTFHRLFAKRGRVVRGFTEVYLRDDIPCGLAECESCAEACGEAAAAGGPGAALPCLPLQPPLGHILVLDTNVVLHQLDVLEGAGGALTGVVVLQTVLEEVRHRSPAAHARLLALLRTPSRRFFPFSNVHHRDTASPRALGETPNDYNDRLVRRAAAWLGAHYAAAGGAGALLVTNDAACSAAAAAEALPVCTLRELVAGRLAQAHPGLLELLAASQERWGAALEEQAALDEGAVAPSAASSSSSSAAAAPAARRGAPGASGPFRYAEHLPAAAVEKGLRERTLFRGTLRVNRECWFEARVMIHSVLGKGSAGGGATAAAAAAASAGLTGGDDNLPLLVLGREALNRAMDGDLVIVELLPRSQWRKPSSVLAGQGASAGEDDEAERGVAAGSDEGGGSASASASGLTPLQEALAAVERGAKHRGSGAGGSGGLEPTARVVSIAARAWRPLCGSLEAVEAGGSAAAAAAAAAGSVVASPHPAGGAGAAEAAGGEAAASHVETALFVPWDSRFPRVRIETRQRAALANKRLVVTLDDWPAASKYPRGHYTRTLGVIGEREAENACIAHEFDIAVREFSPAVMACLPPAHYTLDAREAALEVASGRVDLRAALPGLCSIDPPGCKDIDDALHAVELPASSGAQGRARRTVQVGVHIADVGHFVKQGSAIDVEAALRANTTYLVERRLDMLPGLLTADLCSLKGGVDRLAFSVTWEFEHVGEGEEEGGGGGSSASPSGAARAGAGMEVEAGSSGSGSGSGSGSADPAAPCDDATIQAAAAAESTGAPPAAPQARLAPADRWRVIPGRTRFFKSLIHSRASLTYAAAQAYIDAGAAGAAAGDAVASSVCLLASIARSLRAARLAAGALALSSPEVKFLLDSETHDPLDVTSYVTRESNSTVEEFMLLANCAVAARVTESFPRVALLRRHPAPPPSNFDGLTAAARAAGVALDCASNRALAASLDAAEAALAGSAAAAHTPKLLRILATRCMMQATYFPSGTLPPPAYAHYGLASPLYTHFTSPIRRYADVIVHRLLAAAIGLEALPAAYTERGALSALADNCNRRHLASQLAGRASAALHTHLYFRTRCVVEVGLVIRLKANGAVVLVPRFGLESTVLLGRRSDGSVRALLYSAEEQSLSAEAGEGASASASGGGSAAQPLRLRIFQQVKVALFITERVRGRRELAMRVLEPPFHDMPRELPEGVAVEDCCGGAGGGGGGGGGGAGAGAAGAAAGQATRGGGGGKKKEGLPGGGGGGGGGSASKRKRG